MRDGSRSCSSRSCWRTSSFASQATAPLIGLGAVLQGGLQSAEQAATNRGGGMTAIVASIDAIEAEINAMANQQFETPEFRELFDLPLTIGRARLNAINMAHYVRNRRDCWGYVQGAAPLDVKRLIWEHE